jgi:hypothetical protein
MLGDMRACAPADRSFVIEDSRPPRARKAILSYRGGKHHKMRWLDMTLA